MRKKGRVKKKRQLKGEEKIKGAKKKIKKKHKIKEQNYFFLTALKKNNGLTKPKKMNSGKTEYQKKDSLFCLKGHTLTNKKKRRATIFKNEKKSLPSFSIA